MVGTKRLCKCFITQASTLLLEKLYAAFVAARPAPASTLQAAAMSALSPICKVPVVDSQPQCVQKATGSPLCP